MPAAAPSAPPACAARMITSRSPGPTVARSGFETAIAISAAAPVIEVQALGAQGQVLATSAPTAG